MWSDLRVSCDPSLRPPDQIGQAQENANFFSGGLPYNCHTTGPGIFILILDHEEIGRLRQVFSIVPSIPIIAVVLYL